MQRIVSGENIQGLPNYPSSAQHHKEEEAAVASVGLSNNSKSNSNSNNSDETKMSHSPSVTFGDAANFVENDGDDINDDDNDNDDVMMDVSDTIATYMSESSMSGPQSHQQQQRQQQQGYVSQQRLTSVSPSLSLSLSVPSNDDDEDYEDYDENNRTPISAPNQQHYQHQQQHQHQHQQQHQTPLSIISGLLPTVGLQPISSGTSLGSGLQRSQNSSRDWGWFEDVHHSDQGVAGAVPVGNSKKGRTKGGSPADATATSLQQQRNSTMNNSSTVHGGGISSNNNNSSSSSSRGGGRNNNETTNNTRTSSNKRTIEEGGDHHHPNNNNNTNNNNNRLLRTAASLLPTGDEMLIDEMQEYLEPILIHPRSRDMENEAAVQAVTAPNYVLEESLSDQFLWKETAGNRPPQPVEERAFFEAMWQQNFSMSEVDYRMPEDILKATTPVSLNPFADGNFGTEGTAVTIGAGGTPVADVSGATGIGGGNKDVADFVSSFVVPGGISGAASGHHQNPHLQGHHHRVVRSSSGSGNDLTVFTKGDNVFGTTVSKSFARPSVNGDLVSGVDTVNISVASYRVVESEKRGKHAQFLVIYREGSIRDTIGVWKRYSDFQELSKKVTQVHEGCASVIANMSPLAVTEEHDVEHLPNAITSWHLLKKRKRWYRCLDAGYLSLKVFLLERFLHDILFESSTPDLLRDFVGVPPPR